MKKLFEGITRCLAPTTRALALLFAIGATTGAWAVNKPLAVWNGDFPVTGETDTRGGFTLDLRGNTSNGSVITIVDSANGASGGIFVGDNAAGNYKNMTVVIGLNANDCSFSNNPFLFATREQRSNSDASSDQSDVSSMYIGTDGKFYGSWTAATSGGNSQLGNQNSATFPSGDAVRYIAALHASAPNPNGGLYGYYNGSCVMYHTGLANGYAYCAKRGISLCGRYATAENNLVGAKISYIAIFASTETYKVNAYGGIDEINAWSFDSLTGGQLTTITTTDKTASVNLPAGVSTLTSSATPGAVFVQNPNSTLTLTGSASLTINDGEGPLYVDSGASLTIDATGISGISGDGDSVTLVSGKIYGTDLISVVVPVVTGCKVTPSITDSGITLTCTANNVTFTSPFTGENLSAPTTATGWGNSADQVSFGNDSQFEQTISTRTATVADVFGGTYSTAINGFLKSQETATKSDKDTYLRVSGGSARLVCGVQKCTWASPGTYQTTGDAITQIEGSATYIQYVFGAGSEGGYNNVSPKVTGNTGVTVKGGAVITGSVIGGWGSSHTKIPEVTGNTAVRIECVQNTSTAQALNYIPAGWIIGGSSYQTNSGNSQTKVSGNSSVTVDLDSGATGTFSKNIVGASFLPDTVQSDSSGQAQTVSGNSSVVITAPAGVTFSGKIVGGGYSGRTSSGGSSTVGGNSSVTIDGGTYTGTIVAGGYTPQSGNVSVAGTATLMLNGGTFSGATLRAGTAAGSKSLVIGGDVDLSDATVNDSGFDALSVSASKTLALGEKRLIGASDPVLTAVGAVGKVSFRLTAAEETAKHAVLINCSVADMSGKFTILDSNGADITSSVAEKVSVRNGYLIYMDVNAYTVTIGSGETAWDSVSWSLAGSSETMSTAAADINAEATITLDGGTLVISDAETFAGKLTFTGTGTVKFTGNATLTSDLDITIDSGVTLDFSGLTNLIPMGPGDTIISAVAISVSTSSVTFPSTWTCSYLTSATSFVISGFKTDSDSVSINIIGRGYRISDDGVAGWYPVKGSLWNQIVSENNAVNETDDLAELLAGGDRATNEAGISAQITAPNTYAASGSVPVGANAYMMSGYLDDGSAATITVKNIPYSQYAVMIYMGTDQTATDKGFRPVTVNGTQYCGSGNATVTGSSNWGSYASARDNVTLSEGSNFLKISGLTGSTLSIAGSQASNGNRCGLAGVQIVNTGTRQTIYSATLEGTDATLLPSGTSTGMTKTSGGSWSGSTTSKIILTNPADANSTVTIGENITTGSFKIKGAGTVTLAIGASKTLSINDGKVDLTEFSGTLCVDPTVPYSFFAANEAYKTNNGIVRFIGENLEFTNETSLPFGKIAFDSATLKGSLASIYRTVVVEDGDSVTIDSAVKNTSLNFDVRGGLLTIAATDKFWFGAGSTFTQTGGMVKWECTGTETTAGGSSCGIFGYSSTGATVSISGGIFDMSKATLNVWVSGSSLTLSGDAQFKVKGIIANGTTGRTVSVGGSSKLILTGALGLHTSLATVTLSGGTIELQETATIEKQLTLAASTESAIIVAASKTATLSGGVTGTGTLKLAGAGTIANSTALTNVGAIDFTDGLTVNTAVTLAGGAVISVGDADVSLAGAVTQSGSLVIDGSAITSGDPTDTITISASSGTFTVANVSTQNMPGGWTLDTANSTTTQLRLSASAVATVGDTGYATLAAALAAANSGATKTVTLTSNTGDSRTPITIPEGVTVDFGTYTLTCGTLTVGSGVVVDMANISATKVEGSGTVIYDGTFPPTGLGWTDADNWRGTLTIKSISTKQGLSLNDLGNENSVVRLDGVSDAYFDGTQEVKPTLDLDGSGVTLHYANSGTVVTLSKFTGSGPLSVTGGSSSGAVVVVKDSSLFTGAITLGSGCSQQLIFGDSGLAGTSAKIIVDSANTATVPTGKIWSAAGGFEVNGTLAFDRTGSVGSNVTTANGATLDLSGFTGTAPAISGTFSLVSGTTIKLPAGATLPYQIATAGDGGLLDDVTVKIGETTLGGNLVFTSGTISAMRSVNINEDKTYTVPEVFGTPSATSSYEINVTSDATVTVPDTAVGTILYNFTASGNTITLSGGYKIPATAQYLKITDASTLTAGNYTLFQWTTPQQNISGYGRFASVDTTGLNASLTAEVVYGAKAIYLMVYDKTAFDARPAFKVWAYGDSITEGWNTGNTRANYRVLLAQKLAMRGYNVEMVGCFGQIQLGNDKDSQKGAAFDPSGEEALGKWQWHSAKHGATLGITSVTSYQRAALIENVDTLCAQVDTPDVVLLHGGINDLSVDGVTEQATFDNWSNTVWRILTDLPNTKVVVSTALFAKEGQANYNRVTPKVPVFNNLIKQQLGLVEGFTPERPFPAGRVVLADLNTCVHSADTGILTSDNLHPDWWGHDQMAEGWLEKIVELYPDVNGTFPSSTTKTAPTSEELGAANKTELDSYRAGFTLCRTITAVDNINTSNPYTSVGEGVTANIGKVGYFVEYVRNDNKATHWVWVDMDAFGDKDLASIGLPTANRQQVVTSLHVMSSHNAIDTVAADDDSVDGWIEFSNKNYTQGASGVDGAPTAHGGNDKSMYDWNDTLGNSGTYSCMQVFRKNPPTGRPAQTLFAYNNWQSSSSSAEFGIGNCAQHFWGGAQTLDYTFTTGLTKLDGSAYSVKTIEIWTKPVYTVTINDDANFSNLTFSPTLPANDTSACDLVVNVTDDAELTFDGSLSVDSIRFNIEENKTLSLAGTANLSGTVIISGPGKLLVDDNITVPELNVSGDAIIVVSANKQLTVTGALVVLSGATLTLEPAAISTTSSTIISAASISGNVSMTLPSEAGVDYSTIATETSYKIVRTPNVAFSYDGTIGAAPTGWFTDVAEPFSSNLRVGPDSTKSIVYEVKDGEHPYNTAVTWAGKSATIALYADISQVANTGKPVLVGIGASGTDNKDFILLYRDADKVKLAVWNVGVYSTTATHMVGTAASVDVPSAGYHLYTATFTSEGALTLYCDSVAGTAGSAGRAIDVLPGFQIGNLLKGVANGTWSHCSGDHGLTKGLGMAFAAIRGYDAVLGPDNVAKLAESFPATDGNFSRTIDMNTSGKKLTVYSSEQTGSCYLGVSTGELLIPVGATVSTPQIRTQNNANYSSGTLTIDGTLNVTSTSPNYNVYNDRNNYRGILFGHYTGTGICNISATGSLIGENAYLQTSFTAGGTYWANDHQELNINGGMVKVKGLYANDSNTAITLRDGGTLEVSDIVSVGAAITKNFGYGTFRVKADATETRAINFCAAGGYATKLDPFGNTLTLQNAALTGSGDITVDDSSDAGDGMVVFVGGSGYIGRLIMTDDNASNIDISGYTGTVLLTGDTTVPGAMTFANGLTLQFNDVSGTKRLTLSSTLTFASGTVKIAFGEDAGLYDGAKLIDWTANGAAPAGTFAFDDGNGGTTATKTVSGIAYVLSSESDGLYVHRATATVTFAASGASVAVTGAVSGSGNVYKVYPDGTITFTVTPDNRSKVVAVTASSGTVTGTGPYTYTVSGDATITVTLITIDSTWATTNNMGENSADSVAKTTVNEHSYTYFECYCMGLGTSDNTEPIITATPAADGKFSVSLAGVSVPEGVTLTFTLKTCEKPNGEYTGTQKATAVRGAGGTTTTGTIEFDPSEMSGGQATYLKLDIEIGATPTP